MIDYELAFASLASYIGASIPKLNTYGLMPDVPACPAFAVGNFSPDPNFTFGKMETTEISAYLFAYRAGERASQQWMLRTLKRDPAGQTIWAGLVAAQAANLGGTVKGMRVMKIEGGRTYEFGTNWYYGAKIDITLLG